MSEQGKANYEGYRAAAMGKSLISGAPLPEWDELTYQIKLAWDAGACSVELWLAEAPVDEDMPGNEPQACAGSCRASDAAETILRDNQRLRQLISELLDSTGLDGAERARWLEMAGLDDEPDGRDALDAQSLHDSPGEDL